MATFLKTFGVYALIFLGVLALSNYVFHFGEGLTFDFVVSYVIYRLLRENGV